jgi:transaldolase/glucose-6-phosphate isomerase
MAQRLLWASTGTKEPSYPPTLYVDTLIGPDTISTMPPRTMDAFREHGKVILSLAQDIEGARRVLAETERLRLDLQAVTAGLVEDGVRQFADAADKLLAAVEKKRLAFAGGTRA